MQQHTDTEASSDRCPFLRPARDAPLPRLAAAAAAAARRTDDADGDTVGGAAQQSDGLLSLGFGGFRHGGGEREERRRSRRNEDGLRGQASAAKRGQGSICNTPRLQQIFVNVSRRRTGVSGYSAHP